MGGEVRISEQWTIVGTGLALAGLILTFGLSLKADLRAFDERLRSMDTQLACIEGALFHGGVARQESPASSESR